MKATAECREYLLKLTENMPQQLSTYCRVFFQLACSALLSLYCYKRQLWASRIGLVFLALSLLPLPLPLPMPLRFFCRKWPERDSYIKRKLATTKGGSVSRAKLKNSSILLPHTHCQLWDLFWGLKFCCVTNWATFCGFNLPQMAAIVELRSCLKQKHKFIIVDSTQIQLLNNSAFANCKV